MLPSPILKVPRGNETKRSRSSHTVFFESRITYTYVYKAIRFHHIVEASTKLYVPHSEGRRLKLELFGILVLALLVRLDIRFEDVQLHAQPEHGLQQTSMSPPQNVNCSFAVHGRRYDLRGAGLLGAITIILTAAGCQ